MSTEKVKQEIKRFFESSEPEVITIKGKWGVGKTFYWENLLEELKNDSTLQKYAYVSLFGIDSIDTLKAAISANMSNLDDKNKKIDAEKMIRNIIDKSKGLAKGSEKIVEYMLFSSVKETIVCIDDLERKADKLPIKDVLGLVSVLKEKQKCKVVLLINENEDGLEDYSKYREKVVDYEIEFSPTVKNNFLIVFEYFEFNNNSLDDELNKNIRDCIFQYVQKLNIKNIRILKKIKNAISEVAPSINNFEYDLIVDVISSLVFFVWCHYSDNHDGSKPSLDFTLNIQGSFLLGFHSKDNENEDEHKWKNIIRGYGFTHIDELDIALSDMVKNGYADIDKIRNLADEKNNDILCRKKANQFYDAWKMYSETFKHDVDEILENLYNTFLECIDNVNVRDLDSTILLFRDFNENVKADEMIEKYISARGNKKDIFNIEQYQWANPIIDTKLIEEFNKHYKSNTTKKSAIAVLKDISSNNHCWSPEDEEILSSEDIDYYYKILISKEGDELKQIVAPYWEFKRIINLNDNLVEFINKFEGALKKIAGESELNKYRISKLYGINL